MRSKGSCEFLLLTSPKFYAQFGSMPCLLQKDCWVEIPNGVGHLNLSLILKQSVRACEIPRHASAVGGLKLRNNQNWSCFGEKILKSSPYASASLLKLFCSDSTARSTQFLSSDSPGECTPRKDLSSKIRIGLLSFSQKWAPVMPLRKSFPILAPFLYSQLPLILTAWICTLISTGALFLLVPQVGELSGLLANGNLHALLHKALLMMLLLAVKSVGQFWQQALLWEAALKVTCDVRGYVFEQVVKREMAFFEGQGGTPTSDIAYRLAGAAQDAGDTVYTLLHMLVPCAFQLTAMACRMLFLSPILSVVTISVLPFMSITIAILGERLRKLSRKGQESIASLSVYLNEILLSMFVVKAYGAEEFERMRFKKLSVVDYQAHLSRRRMKAFIPEIITAVYATTAVVMFGVGAWVISKGGLNASSMISFLTSLVFLIEPIQAIGKAYNDLKQGEPVIERLFELTTNYSKVSEKDAAITLTDVCGNVKISNVFFAYGGCPPWVLSNLHIDVQAGETVALVGPSGGGKTTLAKLLLRLYDPVHGKIYIDGHDISDISLKSLRCKVGIVPQEIVIFTGTVLENIAYGVLPDDIDYMAAEQAAILANADEFIQRLPCGYQSNLSDRGSTLSGGQRQRLAIARAIYQNPAILVLDEATSALDNNSEMLVREALNRLMVNRTVFVIAHRLETIRKADRIFVISGGRVVEAGTHCSLMAKDGLYSSLYARREIGSTRSHALIADEDI